MKSTKKLLITGIALASALFASVETMAMNPTRPVNTGLTDSQKNTLIYHIEEINSILRNNDPKALGSEYLKKLLQQREGFEAIYYDKNGERFSQAEFNGILNAIKSGELIK